MPGYTAQLIRYRELLFTWVERGRKARYRQTELCVAFLDFHDGAYPFEIRTARRHLGTPYLDHRWILHQPRGEGRSTTS